MSDPVISVLKNVLVLAQIRVTLPQINPGKWLASPVKTDVYDTSVPIGFVRSPEEDLIMCLFARIDEKKGILQFFFLISGVSTWKSSRLFFTSNLK